MDVELGRPPGDALAENRIYVLSSSHQASIPHLDEFRWGLVARTPRTKEFPMARQQIVCSYCGASMASHRAFDAHAMSCPALVRPNKGEAWADYQKRAAEFALAWRRANGKPEVIA